MMNRKTRNWIVLIELAVGAICFILFLHPFMEAMSEQDISGGGFRTFYRERTNSIDVMVFGSSHAACSFNNDIWWKEDGIASFTLSCGGQNLPETVYYIEEAFKSQHPKVILIETLNADRLPYSEDSGCYELDIGELYRSNLSMRWGVSYLRMVQEQAKRYGISDALKWDMAFKFPVTHSNYSQISQEDYVRNESYIRGYRGDASVGSCAFPEFTEERAELTPLCLESLDRIFDLCNRNNAIPVFFCAPYDETAEEFAIQNSVGDYIREHGYEFIDYNRIYKDIEFDFENDFRDDGNHLNNSGAEKITRALLSSITDKYDFPDHRGDVRYSAWDENSRYLKDRAVETKLRRCSSIREYINTLSEYKEEYGIMLSLSGQYNVLGDEFMSDAFEPIGLSRDDYTMGGSAVFDRGELLYYSGGDGKYHFSAQVGNNRIEAARLNPMSEQTAFSTDDNNNDYLIVDNVDYAHIPQGVNIVVFDPLLGRVIDSVGVDVFISADLVRQ